MTGLSRYHDFIIDVLYITLLDSFSESELLIRRYKRGSCCFLFRADGFSMLGYIELVLDCNNLVLRLKALGPNYSSLRIDEEVHIWDPHLSFSTRMLMEAFVLSTKPTVFFEKPRSFKCIIEKLRELIG